MIAFYFLMTFFGIYFAICSALVFLPLSWATPWVRLSDAIEASLQRHQWGWVAATLGLFYCTEWCWLRWL